MIEAKEELYCNAVNRHNATIRDNYMDSMRNSLGKIMFVDYDLNSKSNDKVEAIKTILSYSDKLITAREASIAMQNSFIGDTHSSCDDMLRYGSMLNEGSLFVPGSKNKRILVRDSLVLDAFFKKVKLTHHNGMSFLPKDFDLDNYLKNNDHIVVEKQNYAFNPNTFSNPITKWLFGDQVENHAEFLRKKGIKKTSLKMFDFSNSDSKIDSNIGSFVNSVYMAGTASLFNIDGYIAKIYDTKGNVVRDVSRFDSYRLRVVQRPKTNMVPLENQVQIKHLSVAI